jgi:hypothetical protein
MNFPVTALRTLGMRTKERELALMSALNQVLPMPSNKKYGQQMQNNS